MNVKQIFRIAILSAALVFIGMAPAFADITAGLAEADELIDLEDYNGAMSALEGLLPQAGSNAERAEVYWRMATATLIRGDQSGDNGASEDQLLSIYEEGEGYADQAIASDPTNPLGYYWKSANIGRWGQTKGVLNSLFRADDMRDLLAQAISFDPNHADSYYVLGQLYARVPGVVSFGDVDYAVSLARRSVDLMEAELRTGERDEEQHDFYVQLASHLIDRDWSARKRGREHSGMASDYRSADSELERGFYYEGTIEIPSVDDEEEAREILTGVIGRLEALPRPLPSDLRRLEKARELLAGL